MNLEKYRNLFFSETREHLLTIQKLLLEAEGSDVFDDGRIDALFRGAHSIKGMAATMGFPRTVQLAHHLENILAEVRKEKAVPAEKIELLFKGFGLLGEIVGVLEKGGKEPDIDPLLARSPRPAAPSKTPPAAEQAPSFVPANLPSTVRLRVEALDHLHHLAGELLTTRHLLENAASLNHPQALKEGLEVLARQISELQEQVRRGRMLSLKQITDPLPLLVRDLSRQQGKRIELRLEGTELELDRALLEALADPLVHLVRNAADHGIREQGVITITARREREQAVITVRDDGRGIDREAVRDKACQLGLIPSSQAAGLDEKALLELICHPGFSTAAGVSGVSGRGVGMDIVREAVSAVGGRLEIGPERGQGACFRITVPLNVAIIHILVVHCGSHLLGIPINRVSRVLEIPRCELAAGKGLSLASEAKGPLEPGPETAPLYFLGDLLGFSGEPPEGMAPVVMSERGGQPFGLIVERVSGHKEVFLRKLQPPLSLIEGLFGAAILDEGRVVFILDPQELASIREQRSGSARANRSAVPSPESASVPSP